MRGMIARTLLCGTPDVSGLGMSLDPRDMHAWARAHGRSYILQSDTELLSPFLECRDEENESHALEGVLFLTLLTIAITVTCIVKCNVANLIARLLFVLFYFTLLEMSVVLS